MSAAAKKQVETVKVVPLRGVGTSLIAAYDGDAGLDLGYHPADFSSRVVRPGSVEMMETGIAVAIPKGYAGLILPRSGMASKRGLRPVNTPGLIDSGYRGEILVPLEAVLDRQIVSPGERIAQLVIVKLPQLPVEIVKELDETERGDNGFGSSGS
jgi:dUTP pyrophosphatase